MAQTISDSILGLIRKES